MAAAWVDLSGHYVLYAPMIPVAGGVAKRFVVTRCVYLGSGRVTLLMTSPESRPASHVHLVERQSKGP